MIPILGPSDVRDGIGRIGDGFMIRSPTSPTTTSATASVALELVDIALSAVAPGQGSWTKRTTPTRS